jgi:chaperonin cofactor prefoldin
MNFLTGLKGIFIAPGTGGDDEVDETVDETDTTAEAKKEEATIEVAVPKTVGAAGIISDEAFTQIGKALEDANMEGFDYFEFAKALEAQKSLQPSEKARYQSVFATGQAIGMSMGILVSSAEHYVGVLKECEDSFLNDVVDQIQVRVTDKRTEAETISAQIDDVAKAKQALEDKINSLVDARTELTQEATANEEEIQKVQNDFGKTITVFKDKITADLNKVKEYCVTPDPVKEKETPAPEASETKPKEETEEKTDG